MNALRLMRWRDLWWLRGQVIATALIVLCAISSFVATYGTWRALVDAQTSYYRDYRFADIFAPLKRAPLSLKNRLQQIEGVAQVELRISSEVLLDNAALNDPRRDFLTSIRLVSLPEKQPVLNAVHLRSGRWPEADRSEVLISETFANANGWRNGDQIPVIMNGRRERLSIVGIALAPEFIYEVGSGALLPDGKRFGVMWMRYERLAPATGMEGAFNEALLQIPYQASLPAVIASVDQLLAPYGGIGAYDRESHPSHQFIRDEISQNRIHATVVPAIFLAVAAFLLHVALSRLISLQRGEIGLLKSFGYHRQQIGGHYTLLAITMALTGAIPGMVIGVWLGEQLTVIYNDYYHFPRLDFSFEWGNLSLALAIAIVAAVLGALLPVWRAIRLPPAEAMRPEPPPIFHDNPWERGISRLSRAPVWRMTVRQLLRRGMRSVLSLLAASIAMALLIMGGYSFDAIDELMRQQFEEINREHVTVMLREPRSPNALNDLYRLPGVLHAEPFRRIPARIRAEHRSKRLSLTAMPVDSEMRIWRDALGKAVPINAQGLTLTRTLAEQLQVKPGDMVQVEVLEGERRVRQLPVSQISDEWLGLAAYLPLHALPHLLGDAGTINGAWLRIDESLWPALTQSLQQLPWLSGSNNKTQTQKAMDELLQRSVMVAMVINVLFAGAIAFGVIYNNLRIALSERGRELASLRVLGFTRQEVWRLLLMEQGIIIMLALPLGSALGYALCAWLSERLVTDAFRLPLIIDNGTYIMAAFVILVAAMLSALMVAKRVNAMKIVDVLKTRE